MSSDYEKDQLAFITDQGKAWSFLAQYVLYELIRLGGVGDEVCETSLTGLCRYLSTCANCLKVVVVDMARWCARRLGTRHRTRGNKGSDVIMTSPSLYHGWVGLGGPNKTRWSLSRLSGSWAIRDVPFRTDWLSADVDTLSAMALSIAMRTGMQRGHGTLLSTPISTRHQLPSSDVTDGHSRWRWKALYRYTGCT